MKNKTIFVACDTSNLNQINKILKNIKTKKLKIIPKFGLQFFYSKYKYYDFSGKMIQKNEFLVLQKN